MCPTRGTRRCSRTEPELVHPRVAAGSHHLARVDGAARTPARRARGSGGDERIERGGERLGLVGPGDLEGLGALIAGDRELDDLAVADLHPALAAKQRVEHAAYTL